MNGFWSFSAAGRLYFMYRARRWDTHPPRYMNQAEITAVSAVALDPSGGSITVSQQPIYVPSLGGYIGYIDAADLTGLQFVSVALTPTLAGGLPVDWAQVRSADIVIALPTNVSSIADAVWDVALSAHVSSGSTGQKLRDIPSSALTGFLEP